MSVEDLQAEPGNVDHIACAFVGADYFVKYGNVKYIKPELVTQEYLFHYAQQPQTPEPPRIAKIVHHFVSQNIMYLVMEHIELQVSPPDLDRRIQGAIEWLSKVPPPPNSKLGPVRGGLIRHRLFKDYEAPFIFSDTAMLDLYMLKAYGVLSKAGKKKSSPVSVQVSRGRRNSPTHAADRQKKPLAEMSCDAAVLEELLDDVPMQKIVSIIDSM